VMQKNVPIGSFLSLSPGKLEELGGSDGNKDVKRQKPDKDSKIPPAMIKLHSQAFIEIISRFIEAVLAVGSSVGVVDVSANCVDVALSVLEALLTTRRREGAVFFRVAFNLKAVHFRNDETRNETGEGVELVHPYAPEVGHLVGDDSDTAEEGEHDKQEGVDGGRNRNTGSERSDSLTAM